MKILAIIAASFAALGVGAAFAANPHAKISTSKGDIIIELYPDKAPKTVANFLQYAKEGLYDRTIFHRVVAGYVIQGGGFSAYFDQRPAHDPVPYEGDNGLKNLRGTIAMARNDDPNSATNEWFINLKDNPKFDHRVTDLGAIYGYAVFGKVVEGMDVVDAIGSVATHAAGPFDAEVPVETIVINRVDEIDWPPSN